MIRLGLIRLGMVRLGIERSQGAQFRELSSKRECGKPGTGMGYCAMDTRNGSPFDYRFAADPWQQAGALRAVAPIGRIRRICALPLQIINVGELPQGRRSRVEFAVTTEPAVQSSDPPSPVFQGFGHAPRSSREGSVARRGRALARPAPARSSSEGSACMLGPARRSGPLDRNALRHPPSEGSSARGTWHVSM